MADLVSALGAGGQPDAGFAALEKAMRHSIGHRLFTIMRHDAARAINQRIYSNMPGPYPPGGEKPVVDSAWSRQLLTERRPFIGRSSADIRLHFADHAVIEALGCESVLNVPVIWNGKVAGTINLLDRADAYSEHHADIALGFTPFALPGLIS